MSLKPSSPNVLSLGIAFLLLATFGGCAGKATFAGFTFGGGGNTYSSEPATITLGKPSRLVAGSPEQPVYLKLEWDSAESDFKGEKIPLTSARVKVESQGRSETLVGGEIVLQAKDGRIGHGSFQATVKLEDGREFPLVGSFTASLP